MQDLPEMLRGRVFTHPLTKQEYGPIRFPKAPEQFHNLDGRFFDVLAEDSCGNYFTATEDGAVWFWDHETNDLLVLCNSLSEFVANCADPEPVELDPKQVKSVWIDPAFAKSIGKKVPDDGWVKKPSESK